MDPFTLIFGGIGALGTISSMVGSSKAQKEQERAQEAAWREKIRAYEFNIGQTEKDIEGLKYFSQEKIVDIRREGSRFMRGQSAAMGASGAVVGVGTPLMAMTETAESTERDVLRAKREKKLGVEYLESDIEFMEQEIEEHKILLGDVKLIQQRKREALGLTG